jgi:hypothetical protein
MRWFVPPHLLWLREPVPPILPVVLDDGPRWQDLIDEQRR